MGLGVAISGGIISSVLIVVMMLYFSSVVDNESTLIEAQLAMQDVDNSFSKTSFSIGEVFTQNSADGFKFLLTNTGNEKFWNYDDFDVSVTYSGNINGTSTTISETLTYNSEFVNDSTCDGDEDPILSAGQWRLDSIENDLLDPGLINTNEIAEFAVRLQYPLYDNSTVNFFVSTDNGYYQSASGTVNDAVCNWANHSWLYRELMQIDHTLVSANLTNFPILVDYTGQGLKNNAQADGDDIFFTSSNKIDRINHELESYSNGVLTAWVNVPSVSSAVDTDIYMYYGNVNATNQENVSGVWNSNYKGVYHFNDNVNDSTLNYNGTNGGSSDVAGKIDRARDFDSDVIDFPSGSWVSGDLDNITMQAWINPDTNSGYDTILGIGNNGDDPFFGLNKGEVVLYSSDTNPKESDPSAKFTPSQWRLATVTYDATTDQVKIYRNGINDVTDTMSGTTDTRTDRTIGNDDDGEPFDGQIDEVRILDVVLTDDWIVTEYNNQNNPDDFVQTDPLQEFGDWYETSWKYRKKITISNTLVDSELANFPVLISMTDSDLMVNATSDGSEIIFTAGNGRVQLDHEMEKYNGETGTMTAWVRVPVLYDSVDTDIYMYYGHTGIGLSENPSGVWNSNYKGVYHFNDNVDDSTVNNEDGTNSGTVNATGKIYSGRDFDSDTIDLPNRAWMSGNLDKITMQAWINPDTISGYDTIIGIGNNGDVPFFGLNDGTIVLYSSDTNPKESDPSNVLSAGTWYLATVTYDATTDQVKIYRNGINDVTDSMSGTTKMDNDRKIGNDDSGESFDGQIDEVRILDVVLTDDWIATEYTNQNSPETFYSVGDQENYGATPDQ